MQNTSPLATGAAAIGGAQVGELVVWLTQILHLSPPPASVASTIGAIVLAGGHLLVNWISSTKTRDVTTNEKPQ